MNNTTKTTLEAIALREKQQAEQLEMLKNAQASVIIVEVTEETPLREVVIIEPLDYGMNLLSDGRVLKKDGTVISQEEYAKMQELQSKNQLSWVPLDIEDFMQMLEDAHFATQTYNEAEEIGGMEKSKSGFACIDSDGTPYYLRTSSFTSNETFEFTECGYSQLIYNVDRNTDRLNILSERLQDLFGVTEQVGSEFSPDDSTTYLSKKFIKDGHVWSMVFKNGELSNIKQGEKIHLEAPVQPKNTKLADAINNGRFTNLV